MLTLKSFFKSPTLLLFIIVVLISLCNLAWINLNHVPISQDTAGHTNLSFIYANIFRELFPAKTFKEFLQVSSFYPPLMFWLGGMVGYFTGFFYKNLQYFASLFLPLCTIFLYLYVRQLTKNSWTALFSASFFIFFPHVWDQSRYFMLDLPLTTFIFISLCFLEKSRNLNNLFYVVLFFIFATLAQLTKWYAFIYLMIPFLYSFYQGWQKTKDKLEYTATVCLFIIIAAGVALPWYWANFNNILTQTAFYTQPNWGDPANPLSLKNLTYYLLLLINYQIVSLQFVWLVIAFFLARRARVSNFLLLTIAFVYLVFTIIGNKNLRYIMPLLPFLAIVMGWVLAWVKPKIWRWSIFGVLLVFNLGLFFINSFSFPVGADILLTQKVHPNIDSIYLLDLSSRAIQYRWQDYGWSPKIIVDDLDNKIQEKTSVLVVANNINLSVASLDVFSLPTKSYLSFVQVPFDLLEKIQTDEQIANYIKYFPYILVPDQKVAPVGEFDLDNMDAIRKYILAGKTRDWALVKTYAVPHYDTVYLLQKNPSYNTLSVNLSANNLIITRNPAIANIYLQYSDQKNNWTQDLMSQHETNYTKDLTGLKTIRIDYPKNLMGITALEGWQFDGDKEFDRIK